jgi:hypothetical protein
MDTISLPDADAYPVCTPINFYKRGFDLVSEKWRETESLKDANPGSADYDTYVAWRIDLVIWTCSAIESCVNLEGVTWMGEDLYKDNIERSRIDQRLRLMYAFKHQAKLVKDNEIVKKTRALFDVRNAYVHPKTRCVKENDEEKSRSGPSNFDRPIAYTPESLWEIVQEVNGLLSDPDE